MAVTGMSRGDSRGLGVICPLKVFPGFSCVALKQVKNEVS